MADKDVSESELRRLVLEVLATGLSDDWGTVRTRVMDRVKEEGLGALGRAGVQRINQVIIGLILEQLVTIGKKNGDSYSPMWPPVMLTELGTGWAQESVGLRDPDGYAALLKSSATGVEDATVEYALEAFRCLRQNLLFASAVMIGAAAEREVFRLGRTILNGESDEKVAKRLKEALERSRLPTIFQEVRSAVERAIQNEKMPHSVHQGATEHLLSFQEMVRVQRNDAVHSGGSTISRAKVFLSVQTFPVALGALDRLRLWFEARQKK